MVAAYRWTQVGCLGLTVSGQLSLSLNSSYGPNELSQWPSHYDHCKHCYWY